MRQIFDLCARGAGLKVITKTLNAKRDTEGQNILQIVPRLSGFVSRLKRCESCPTRCGWRRTRDWLSGVDDPNVERHDEP